MRVSHDSMVRISPILCAWVQLENGKARKQCPVYYYAKPYKIPGFVCQNGQILAMWSK